MPPASTAVLLALLAVVVAACSPSPVSPTDTASADATAGPDDDPTEAAVTFAPPPADIPTGPLDEEVALAVARSIASVGNPEPAAIRALGDTGDPRVLWVLSDWLRIAFDVEIYDAATDAADELSGLDLRAMDDFSWGPLTDHLIAWDLPAFDGYVDTKAAIYRFIEPGWAPFFEDADADIDWRLVSWGGVRIDDRPAGATGPCPNGCIPALDDPALTPASEGDWYPDDAIVFGVQIGDEVVAFPRNIMEVHEMVNATIGGRRVAMPYCTLCGAAQVFFTDADGGGTGEIVMRTSGLLHRSNKVMYDLTTQSVFDTFTGRAVSGPLHDAGTQLEQATVVTTTWAEWRDAHPDTTIVAEDGGIGRSYDLDPLGGRDDDGPIFPIGDRDDRLGVHDQVLGVILADGTPVAFPADEALAALDAGEEVSLAGVHLLPDAGGLPATLAGEPLASHQAGWFAWSQFHPDTLLWAP